MHTRIWGLLLGLVLTINAYAQHPPISPASAAVAVPVAASRAHAESEYMKKLRAALTNYLVEGPPEAQELVFIRSK